MSVEIWADINTTKQNILNDLKLLGFVKSYFFLGDKKGTVWYSHFNPNEYQSLDGVEITITSNKNKIHISGRVRANGSYYDREKLNNTFRILRRIYKFSFKSDYGQNRYIPLDQDESTPISRGIFYYSKPLKERLETLARAIPDPIIKLNSENSNLVKFIDGLEPMIDVYNAILPLLVAYIEEFYKNVFVVLIKHDEIARNRLTKKIELKNILDAKGNFQSLEELIANSYNFQNSDVIKKTFKKIFKLDVNITTKIIRMIEMRHNLVHNFALVQLSKKEIILFINSVIKMIDNVLFEIETKYKIKIHKAF